MIAARKAAWIVLLIAVGLQMFSYLVYLGIDGGGLQSGVCYGRHSSEMAGGVG